MELNEFEKLSEKEIEDAKEECLKISDKASLEAFKGRFLGKKSNLTAFYAQMRTISQDQKKAFGEKLTALKTQLNRFFEEKDKELKDRELNKRLEKEKVDISLPGFEETLGSKHPFYAVVDDITDFFVGLGFTVADGPEVESDRNNFELMNIPADHPARDMQDSFSIDPTTVLRSHTSCVQARVMQQMQGKGPVKIICPGKVYRRDNDATHSHQFGQIEGLVISEDCTFSNLLETLTLLLKHLFGEKREIRFRPSFFPFTEPSLECDFSCVMCGGKGCGVCKNSGWLEIVGAGMVNPKVLENVGYNPEEVQGFAFGFGLERLAMIKHRINDLRIFSDNDLRFLQQF